MMQNANRGRLDGILRLQGAALPRLALLMLLALGNACSREERPAPIASAAPALPADSSGDRLPLETASAAHGWLAELKRAHAVASAAKTDADKRAALGELGVVFERGADISRKLGATPSVEVGSVPKSIEGPRGEVAQAEIIALRQDAASRAARIELELGGAAAALAWAERGLALSETPSVLRANLLMDAADAHKLSGRPALGKPFLLEALRINQRLLDEELEHP